MAEPNGIVIGGDLYQIVKSFSFVNNEYYQFRELRGAYSVVGFKQMYPVYRVLSKNNNSTAGLNINNINQLFRSNETSKIKDVQIKQPLQVQHQQPKYLTNILVVDDERIKLLLTNTFFFLLKDTM